MRTHLQASRVPSTTTTHVLAPTPPCTHNHARTHLFTHGQHPQVHTYTHTQPPGRYCVYINTSCFCRWLPLLLFALCSSGMLTTVVRTLPCPRAGVSTSRVTRVSAPTYTLTQPTGSRNLSGKILQVTHYAVLMCFHLKTMDIASN